MILSSNCRNKSLRYYDQCKKCFDQPVKKNDLRKYDNIQKIKSGQEDDFTTGSLLDCSYFKKYYKMIAIDFSKQQLLDDDSKAIQKFTENLDQAVTTFFLNEAKEIICDKMAQYNSLNVKWSNF